MSRRWEPLLSPLVGAITGAISAATGVFVIPAVPYLQAIGLEKEELVQALGLSFTVSNAGPSGECRRGRGLHVSMAGESVAALVFACAGMWVGQAARLRMSPAVFRRWFFVSLLLLGLYLVARAAF